MTGYGRALTVPVRKTPCQTATLPVFVGFHFPMGILYFRPWVYLRPVKRKDVSPEIDNNQGWKLALEVRIDAIEAELFTLWIYVLRGPASLSLVICDSASRPNLEEKTRPGNKQWI